MAILEKLRRWQDKCTNNEVITKLKQIKLVKMQHNIYRKNNNIVLDKWSLSKGYHVYSTSRNFRRAKEMTQKKYMNCVTWPLTIGH
jgi:hypothetical protein